MESCQKALSVTTHYTGSSKSNTATPCMDMGSPPISPRKESRFSNFNFTSPIRTLRNKRQSGLPSYHSTSPLRVFGHHRRTSSAYSRSISGESKKPGKKNRDSDIPDMPLQISAPLNVNTQFSHLTRPNLAHHPSVRRGTSPKNDDLKDFKF